MITIPLRALGALAHASELAASRGEATPLDKLKAADMTPLARFHANRLSTTINHELANVEAARVELVRQFGEPVLDKTGEVLHHKVTPGSQGYAEFAAALESLYAGSIEIAHERLSLADVFGKLNGYDLDALAFLFVECQG